MKRFKFSLIYLVVVLATTPYHHQLERWAINWKGLPFITYILLGLLAAFFCTALVRLMLERRMAESAPLFLAAALVSYFIFQRNIYLSLKFFPLFLHIFEFFVLGFLMAWENRKGKSFFPIVTLVIAALAFEAIQMLLPGRIFDPQDAWFNAIFALAGYVVGFF
ncbi:MAG TPA: VanZ family protein [Candidatus Aminicenantes bacterium]|nr:VanZ family protein [Candidatus Aminicenantes bacterium]